MLRSLSRLRLTAETIRSIGRYSTNTLLHQDAMKKRIEIDQLKGSTNEEMKRTRKYASNEEVTNRREEEQKTVESVSELNDEDAQDLFESIEHEESIANILIRTKPHIGHLTPRQIYLCYHQINYLLYKSQRFRVGDPSERPYQRNIDTIQTSPVFTSLLDRSIDCLEQLSIDCLLQMIGVFSLTYLRPDDRAVVSVVEHLKARLNNLELNEVLNLLKYVDSYIKHAEADNKDFQELMRMAFDVAKNQFESYKSNKANVEVMCKGFHLFSNSNKQERNSKIIAHLTDLLLLPRNQFSLQQSVKILRSIILAHRQYNFNASDFSELIRKCNTTICDILEKAPTIKNVLYYAVNLHSFRNQAGFNIKGFYEPKILELSASVLIEESYLQTNAKHLILTLNYNFSRQQIFNERFLMYLFDLVSRNHMFRTQISVRAFFELYSNYRLPFLNYQELANLVEEKFHQIEKVSNTKTTGLMTLVGLISNDALINENLFAKFDNLITRQLSDLTAVKEFKVQQVNQILNSTVYLSMFGQMDADQKDRMLKKMNCWVTKILEDSGFGRTRPLKSSFKEELRFTCLSNGVYVGTVLVYDKSIKDLIPLDNYQEYTQKIEKLPLTENQQLLAFGRRYRLLGDISRQYDTAYLYTLNRILEHYNIRLIEIYHDEVETSGLEHLTQYFIKKTKETFKS